VQTYRLLSLTGGVLATGSLEEIGRALLGLDGAKWCATPAFDEWLDNIIPGQWWAGRRTGSRLTILDWLTVEAPDEATAEVLLAEAMTRRALAAPLGRAWTGVWVEKIAD